MIRIPIVPGSDPRIAYGDLAERGVKGVVLEAFGVGNMPDLPQQGWMPWLRQQTKKGLQVGDAAVDVMGDGCGSCRAGSPMGSRPNTMASMFGARAQLREGCRVGGLWHGQHA